jgi:5-methylthioribose kinase
MTTANPRASFLRSHPDVFLVDPRDVPAIERYLVEHSLFDPEDLPIHVERAGEGNMNLTLRVGTPRRTLILKQGRPWVEKYPLIAAPWERTAVEGCFYRFVAAHERLAAGMPALLSEDRRHHILALEDLGAAADLTSLYADGVLDGDDLRTLLDWLRELGRVPVVEPDRSVLANRAMRQLNHEHIFRLPLDPDNGLDLDAFAPGLVGGARKLQQDDRYRARVAALGGRYLADGAGLVHGDYFPGSWLRAATGLRVIDPEFCFVGAREFDYGVMLAHLALGRARRATAETVLEAASADGLDLALVLGFAGAEIMRRLIGVAQLPLPYGTRTRLDLLELSRVLVLEEVRWSDRWVALPAD